jgi:uncharacterized membrane protein
VIRQLAAVAAVVAGAAACLALAYLSSSGRLPPLLSVGIAMTPLLAGALALSWRSPLRWPVLLAATALVVVAALQQDRLAQHVSALWFVQHVAGHAMFALVFGRTLLPGKVPLTTRIARAVLPSMPQAVVRYSRGVTLAWTIYFVAMAAVSVAIYFGSSTAVWSTFATAVSGPLVALMFVLEFAVRRCVLPASHCGTLAQSVAGFHALMREPSARPKSPAHQPHG